MSVASQDVGFINTLFVLGDDLILQGSPSENDVRIAQPGKGIRPYVDVELDYLMAVWVDV